MLPRGQDGRYRCSIATASQYYCAGRSLTTGLIVHCLNGSPRANTCNKILTNVPPNGVKVGAECA